MSREYNRYAGYANMLNPKNNPERIALLKFDFDDKTK